MATGDLGYQVISQQKFTRGEAGTVNTLPGYNTHQNLIQSIPLPDTGKGDTRSSNILIVSEDLSGLPAAFDFDDFTYTAETNLLEWFWTKSVVPPGGRPIILQEVQESSIGPTGPWSHKAFIVPGDPQQNYLSGHPNVFGITLWSRILATNANGTTASNQVLSVTIP